MNVDRSIGLRALSAEVARISTLMGNFKEGYKYYQRAEPIMIAGGAGNLLLVMLFYHGYGICCARLLASEKDKKDSVKLDGESAIWSYLQERRKGITKNRIDIVLK